MIDALARLRSPITSYVGLGVCYSHSYDSVRPYVFGRDDFFSACVRMGCGTGDGYGYGRGLGDGGSRPLSRDKDMWIVTGKHTT